MLKAHRFLLFIGLALVLLNTGVAAADEPPSRTEASAEVSRNDTLILGRVTTKPDKHYKRLVPILDYVTARMQDLGVKKGVIRLARNNEEMIQFLRTGQIDWVTETLFSGLLFEEKGGAEVLLRGWKRGTPAYHTVFIARKDSPIVSLADLNGKTIAFEDSGSTTGFFWPMLILKKNGLNPTPLSSISTANSADRVKYSFAGGELNVAALVERGRADAGAFSDLNWANPHDTPDGIKAHLRIIHQGQPLPRAMELVRGGLAPEIRARLRDILLHIHEDPEGRAALEAYAETERFDDFDPATIEILNEARRALKDFR